MRNMKLECNYMSPPSDHAGEVKPYWTPGNSICLIGPAVCLCEFHVSIQRVALTEITAEELTVVGVMDA